MNVGPPPGCCGRFLICRNLRPFSVPEREETSAGGFPALGVKLGLPDKPVVAIVGDGGAGWSIQSLWTAARYHIPVTFVITNNATYRQVKLVRKMVLGEYPLTEKHEGMELDDPVLNFSMIAQSMGVKGESVKDPADLGRVLKAAFDSGEPRLVEVFVENRP